MLYPLCDKEDHLRQHEYNQMRDKKDHPYEFDCEVQQNKKY